MARYTLGISLPLSNARILCASLSNGIGSFSLSLSLMHAHTRARTHAHTHKHKHTHTHRPEGAATFEA